MSRLAKPGPQAALASRARLARSLAAASSRKLWPPRLQRPSRKEIPRNHLQTVCHCALHATAQHRSAAVLKLCSIAPSS